MSKNATFRYDFVGSFLRPAQLKPVSYTHLDVYKRQSITDGIHSEVDSAVGWHCGIA